MAVNMQKLTRLEALDALAAKADAKIKEVETKANAAYKGAKVINGNQIGLYTVTDTTGTPALTLDLPAEMVVDALKTGFVSNFNFANGNYTGATNPNLDGQAVLVLAINSTDKGATTTSYSFISVNSLVDTYTAADNTITVNGYTIAVKVSPTAGNALKTTANGLFVDTSDKQDKDTDAVANNVAKMDTNGNAVDGGIAIDDVITNDDIASLTDVNTALDKYFTLAGA